MYGLTYMILTEPLYHPQTSLDNESVALTTNYKQTSAKFYTQLTTIMNEENLTEGIAIVLH